MKLIKDNFDELKYSILRDCCKKIQEIYLDTSSSQGLCINCGTQQNTNTCLNCKSNDYLIPYNDYTKKLLESQEFFDNLNHNVRNKIIEALDAQK